MHRFFLSSLNISGDKIIISDKEQIHYLKNVLRLAAKEKVMVFDHKGQEYLCRIKELLRNKIILETQERLLSKDNKLHITIACAIPKKSKMDDIIDKLTQLGADRIIPMETERVIVKLGQAKKASKLERWKKIAVSASQQSQRAGIPVIDGVKNIQEVLREASSFDLKLIPTLTAERRALLRSVLAESRPRSILVLIGPEGDFTPKEIDLAKNAGFIPVSLGDLVLRVETAAVAITSVLNYTLK
jgi:16S rRNA (uracil1498-N3)-methyltransferase